jgi:6-phosphogluconolactonase
MYPLKSGPAGTGLEFSTFGSLKRKLMGLKTSSPPNNDCLVFVGTYTVRGSEGIYAYRFNPDQGELNPLGLVAKTDSPSFITIDYSGKFLYAVNELDSFQNQPTGAVSVFAINKGSGKLKLLQQISSEGAAPAHLSLDKSGQFLLVANYNSGNIAVFPVGKDGKLGPYTTKIQHSGSSVNPDRQTGPHAHFIQASNDNKFILTADLGIDEILVDSFDDRTGLLTPADPGFTKMEPGSGPRHLVFTHSGKFVYVISEINSTITVFSYDAESGRMQKKQTLSSLPDDFEGINTAGEITIDSKGKYLYVSNRGDNSIGQFRINPDEGSLIPFAWVSGGGKSPRHFEIDPTGKWLFAANQDSDNIVLFRINQDDGRLTQISDMHNIVAPVCVRFLKMQ